MSADPFNFGSPNAFPTPPPGGQPPGGQSNPFGGSVPDNPLSAPTQGQSPRQTMFPGTAASGGELVVAKPPTWLLFAAAGLALLAGVVALVQANPVVAIVCWLLAGPVAIGLLALFVVKDTFARSSGLYAAPDWVKPMHYVAICVCLLCILAPALRLAYWVGRL